MLKSFSRKLLDSTIAVVPITLLVVVISFFLPELNFNLMSLFVFGAILVIIGMAFFTIGADIAIMEFGREMGAHLARRNKMWLIILVPLAMGFLVALSEPDIQILGELFKSNGSKNMVLIIVVSCAVAIMLLISILRANFQIPLKIILLVFYSIIFFVGIFVEIYNPEFLAMAFDSGGIATGPMTVPFLMAFGIGFANVKGGKGQSENSFGVLGLCTAGPILSVLIFSLLIKTKASAQETAFISINKFSDIFMIFLKALPGEIKLVSIALAPILVIFIVFQIFAFKLPRQSAIRIIIGLFYSLFGLSIFLASVNSCFMPVGQKLGYVIASKSFKWILAPLGIVIGALIALAEPSIHILTKQVDEITGGSISRNFMLISLCSGIGIAAGMGMIRILTSISIWWFLVPVYAISLALTFVVKPIFTGIAFDSGSVASGPMTATFVLPFALGACQAIGGNPLTDAFGLVAFVSMTPILTIQLMGLVFKIKTKKKAMLEPAKLPSAATDVSVTIPISSDQPISYDEPETQVFDDYDDEPIDYDETEEDDEDIMEKANLIFRPQEETDDITIQSEEAIDSQVAEIDITKEQLSNKDSSELIDDNMPEATEINTDLQTKASDTIYSKSSGRDMQTKESDIQDITNTNKSIDSDTQTEESTTQDIDNASKSLDNDMQIEESDIQDITKANQKTDDDIQSKEIDDDSISNKKDI